MVYKIGVVTESLIILLTIHWQPLFGTVSAILAGWYYMAMLKINVVDEKHGGSWKNYFKSFFKRK